MSLNYGTRFADQWRHLDPETLALGWAEELAGYSGAELKRGLAEMARHEWPPSLPQFKKWCRPPLDPLTAYHEAVRGLHARTMGEVGHWSHPAVYWAAVPMAFELRSQTYTAIAARWTKALEAQIALGQWDAIPPPLFRLPGRDGHAPEGPINPHVVKMWDDLAQGRKAAWPRDGRSWAYRIMERVEQGGDRYTTRTVVEMARTALGMTP